VHRRARTAHRARQRPKRKTKTALTAPTSVVSPQTSEVPAPTHTRPRVLRGQGPRAGARGVRMGVVRIPPGGQPQRSELMGRRAYRRRGHFRPHCGCFPHTMQNSVRHHWQVTVRSARFDPPQGEWKRRWCEGEWKRRWCDEGGLKVSGSEGGRCTGSQEVRQQLPSPKSPRRGWWEGMV